MADPKLPDPKPVAAPELSTADAIRLLAESLKQKSPLEYAGLTPEQIKRVIEPPAWVPKFRFIRCKSDETGATFEAHVLESRDTTKFPHGRIVGVRGYTHPEGVDVFQSNGGLVPDGMQILVDGTATTLTHMYKQWRWTTFYQTDLKRYVQRAISALHCADGDGLKTPWIAGAVRALDHDDDAAA